VLVDLVIVEDLWGKVDDWFHHWIDERSRRINQNEVSAMIQFIGDKWGIIKLSDD
jgi:hypothetical protein